MTQRIDRRQAIPCQAVPWFTERDYPVIRAVMNDGGALPEAFERWRFAAETQERDLREQGFEPVRIIVTAGKFVGWCGERMLHLDATARAAYARFMLENERGSARQDA